jgi:hypothetical protein
MSTDYITMICSRFTFRNVTRLGYSEGYNKIFALSKQLSNEFQVINMPSTPRKVHVH